MSPTSSVRLRSLRVERTDRPIGIDLAHPRFSWIVEAPDARGVRQRSWRIRVVRIDDGLLVWDSGLLFDPASVDVRYDGSALDPATAYTWRVEVDTSAGTASAVSDFVTGLFESADWGGAAWIGAPRAHPIPDPSHASPAPVVRTEFVLDRSPIRALLFFAAGAYADFRINGRRAGDHVLAPGFTAYDSTVQYDAVEVTGLLEPGENALSAELGRGFYAMTGGNVWNWDRPPWRDEPVVRALLHIHMDDGLHREVVTDGSWRIHDGPTRFDDLYSGEHHDARAALPGVDLPGYDDAGWARASEVPGPAGRLVHQRQPPIRIVAELAAESVDEPRPGVHVLRFPRVVAGTARVVANGEAGREIELRYGERLGPDGTVDQSNNGRFAAGFQTDRMTLAGSEHLDESWSARFSYKGFQYVQVSGWPSDGPSPAEGVTALVTHSDLDVTARFASSSPLLERIHDAVVATLLNNVHGIPTDTPMFEKNGWTGDAAVGAEMFLTALDAHELLAKWADDIHDARTPEGAPSVIAPVSGSWGDWGPAPPWHLAYVEVPWQLYRLGGDPTVMARLWSGIERYLNLEYTRSVDGIADTVLGDWVSPDASPLGGNPREDRRIAGTAALFRMLDLGARMAAVLGEEGAGELRRRAERVRVAFDREFWDEVRGHYRGADDDGYRQSHDALAVGWGLPLTAHRTERAVARLADDVRDRGMHLNTGVLGTKQLLPVLTDHGHVDVAIAVATQTGYPGWGHMIENGATTVWEHWSLAARSRGHYFLGTIEDWLIGSVLGIRAHPEHGWRKVVLAPAVATARTPGALTGAEGSVETPWGTVALGWERRGERVTFDLHIPIGVEASLEIAEPRGRTLVEAGASLVTSVSSRGASTARLASGRHRIVLAPTGRVELPATRTE